MRRKTEEKILTKALLSILAGKSGGMISSEPEMKATGFAPTMIGFRVETEVEEGCGGKGGSVSLDLHCPHGLALRPCCLAHPVQLCFIGRQCKLRIPLFTAPLRCRCGDTVDIHGDTLCNDTKASRTSWVFRFVSIRWIVFVLLQV